MIRPIPQNMIVSRNCNHELYLAISERVNIEKGLNYNEVLHLMQDRFDYNEKLIKKLKMENKEIEALRLELGKEINDRHENLNLNNKIIDKGAYGGPELKKEGG